MPRLQSYQEVTAQLQRALPEHCRDCTDAQIFVSVYAGNVVLENETYKDRRQAIAGCIDRIRKLEDCEGDPVGGTGCQATNVLSTRPVLDFESEQQTV